MKRNQLAIVVKEKEYTRRIADYIRGSSFGERWQVSAFTHPNACKQFAKQGYAIDLIVAEPDLLRELQPELSHIPSITLVARLGETNGQPELLQYQALPLLLQGISDQFEAMGHKPMRGPTSNPNGNGALVLTVHSASGGVGKTTLALHLTGAASARGLRMLYLNLERWNTSELWLQPGGEAAWDGEGLSELLYAIKSGASSHVAWLAQHRKFHPQMKCDYLRGFRNQEDRASLLPVDAAAMVESIAQSGHYDGVVVDMDDGMDELHFELLMRADRNLWVISEERSALAKQTLMLQYGRQKFGEAFEKIAARSEVVCNGMNAELGNPMPTVEVALAPVALPLVREWRRGELHPVWSSSSYRAAADRLCAHLLGGNEDLRIHAVG
ncbi:hypothetical protein D3P07_04250 [Paenibacillus sp. 1011MAR3C5]|uniref:hypothetical protein n=1 Tax=Paenibacillus sp. 1011MAR3C5 TaxID=1675787 RepID=UPI000E6C491D|nr:hypothetical protein [Paenibacillus sp. 1011MAR3C5]RJE91274.1 hypothetical protein D3P07_04250 [Paenibacillus sp. 1011MAR3C5]